VNHLSPITANSGRTFSTYWYEAEEKEKDRVPIYVLQIINLRIILKVLIYEIYMYIVYDVFFVHPQSIFDSLR
jgi:hypothetical protein